MKHPDALAPGRYASSVHPTSDCVDFMRRSLLDDLDDLYNEAPRQVDWRAITADAGVPFPTPEEIRLEDWGQWHDEVTEQLRNASGRQVDRYYRQKYNTCSACENEDLRASPARHR